MLLMRAHSTLFIWEWNDMRARLNCEREILQRMHSTEQSSSALKSQQTNETNFIVAAAAAASSISRNRSYRTDEPLHRNQQNVCTNGTNQFTSKFPLTQTHVYESVRLCRCLRHFIM